MMNRLAFFSLLLYVIVLSSCDRVPSDPKGDEMARFNAWIAINNLDAYKQPSGLYYISEKEGAGSLPNDSDLVVYNYVLRNLDGYIYENTFKDTAKSYDIYGIYSTKTHYTPKVAQYFKSSKPHSLFEGIGNMKVGGKIRVITPSSLAYGSKGGGTVPSYTSLIWDIELEKIFNGTFTEYEQSLIDEYKDSHPTFNPINDTVYKRDILAGTNGRTIADDSVVTVNYIGRFVDGFIFDTNIKSVAIDSSIYDAGKTYNSLVFIVGSTTKVENDGSTPPLKGFQYAVKQMKEGEVAEFIIPSKFMYGSTGTTGIPPYTPLIFEITVVKVESN